MDTLELEQETAFLNESISTLTAARNSPDFLQSVHDIARVITTCFRDGGKLLLAGNGGSAGDAQHIAGEFLSRLNFDRAPLPAIALTTDTSVLTAIGNDYGYQDVFKRQVLGLGRPGDVFIGISTSGRSPNVVGAMHAARELGLITVGFLGEDPRDMGPLCDLILKAPSGSTPLIQQIHIVAAHLICGRVERDLFEPAAR